MSRALPAILLIVSAGSALFAMGRRPQKTPTEVAPMQQWNGHRCAIQRPRQEVVADASTWESLWKEAKIDPPGDVDFSVHTAVVVFAGSVSTGGYRIIFGRPKNEAKDVLLPFQIKGPPPTAFVIQAFTEPWAAIVLPKPEGTVKLVEAK